MFQNMSFGERLRVPALAQSREGPTLQKTGIIGIILTSWDVGITRLLISQGCHEAYFCLVHHRRLINVICHLNNYEIIFMVIMFSMRGRQRVCRRGKGPEARGAGKTEG